MWLFVTRNRSQRFWITPPPKLTDGEGFRPLPNFLRFVMKIILSRDCAIDGRHHSAGETVDVSDQDGIALVNMGKAQPKGKAKEKKDRSVGLTTSDAPALVKRGRGKK